MIVFNCGNLERIGIRHRKTQTLYLSDLININSCRHPAYGKLQVGLYIAAIKDAVDRTVQKLNSKDVDKSEQPALTGSGRVVHEDDLDIRSRKRTKLDPGPSIDAPPTNSDILQVCCNPERVGYMSNCRSTSFRRYLRRHMDDNSHSSI